MFTFLQSHPAALLSLVLTVLIVAVRLFFLWKEFNDLRFKDEPQLSTPRYTVRSHNYPAPVRDAA